jgi:hypothetical protein
MKTAVLPHWGVIAILYKREIPVHAEQSILNSGMFPEFHSNSTQGTPEI